MTTPTICDACLTGSILAGDPRGTMGELGGLSYYLSEPETLAEGGEGKVVIIATDIFGLAIPNPKLLADSVSKALSLPVYVPDLLEGDSAPLKDLYLSETLMAQEPFYKRAFALLRMYISFLIFIGPTFLYRHRMGVLLPLAEQFCASLRTEIGVKRIGVVGYCLGGSLSTKLASKDSTAVDVVVTAHPGLLTAEDFKAINKPFALVCAEEDFTFDSLKPTALKSLDAKKAAGLAIAVYEHPGTVHGFAIRPDVRSEVVAKEFEKATGETVEWFRKYL